MLRSVSTARAAEGYELLFIVSKKTLHCLRLFRKTSEAYWGRSFMLVSFIPLSPTRSMRGCSF